MASAKDSPLTPAVRISGAAYWVLFLFVPTLMYTGFQDPGNTLRFFLASAALSPVLIIVAFRKEPLNRLPAVFIVVSAVWLCWTVCTIPAAPNTGEALYVAALRLIPVAGMMWLAQQRPVSGKNRMHAAMPLTVFALLQCAVGFAEVAGWVKMPGALEIPSGTTGHQNLFGCLLALLLPFPCMLRASRVVVAGILVIMLTAIFLSESFTAWLAGGMCIAVTLVLYFIPTPVLARRIIKVAIPSGAGLVILLPIVIALLNFDKTERIDKNITGITERALVWRHTAEIASENLLTGTGPAGWKYEILEHGLTGLTTGYAERYFAQPHNDFLWVLAESGIVGIAAWSALLFFLLVIAVRKLASAVDRHEKLRYCALTGGLFAWLCVSGFQFPLERVDHLLVFAALGGLILQGGVNGKAPPGILNKGVYLLAAALCSVMAVFAANRAIHEKALQEMLRANRGQNWDGVLKWSGKAEGRFTTCEYFSSTPIAWYKGMALYHQGKYPDALTELRRANRINPAHPHVLNNIASAFVKTGQLDSALVYYAETRKIFTDFPDPYLNASAIFCALKDTAKAILVLESWPDEVFYRSEGIRQTLFSLKK